jgi:hypothetical protein
MVPALAGGVVSPLPWLGWVISLAAGIYALVLAYRFMPLFLAVPEDKRIVHFVVSILVAFVVNLVGAGIIALLFAPDLADYAGSRDITSEPGRGVFGDLERQADFADQAGRDRYTPPSNGRLSEAQVAGYVRTLQRTAELRERLGAKFENTENDNPSIGAIFSGVNDAVRLGTAEMEVVKTAGGNWAEHLWVKNEIEVARVQRDSSPAVEHNYELFLEYQDEIEKYE